MEGLNSQFIQLLIIHLHVFFASFKGSDIPTRNIGLFFQSLGVLVCLSDVMINLLYYVSFESELKCLDSDKYITLTSQPLRH